MSILLNDIHSQLNPTCVRRIIAACSIDELRNLILQSGDLPISIAGGRHAMGGQQFGEDTLHLDTRTLNRVLDFDPGRGLVRAQAGIQWPELIAGIRERNVSGQQQWGIRQKQTGASDLTLGGALSANVHGRGLHMRPFIADVEEFTLIDHQGELMTCSRTENKDLFRLVIGGYGLFGVIYDVTLRLSPRRRVQRCVDLETADVIIQRYHDRLADLPAEAQGSEVISELYVPRTLLHEFLRRAAEVLRRCEAPVTYGTLRLIQQDDESFLRWAKQDYACVIFNLLTPATHAGRQRTARAFRWLYEVALEMNGSFYLTYHAYATREQVESAYPQMAEFLDRKRDHDPSERFQSTWYRHMKSLVTNPATPRTGKKQPVSA